VKEFGPGSEGVSTKLLDDLAVDPSGESRLSWDIAIGEAIHALKELQRGQVRDKGSAPDVRMEPGSET
jgi:hypothetical protein